MSDKEKSQAALREEDILKFWQESKIFEKSLQKESPAGEYVFYDGPPFATGLPHYGHILASTIKDIIPRYKTMQGFHVPRRWGWDCHGLPIENIVEKELGFKHKKDIKDFGIAKFNALCRERVLAYAHEWERIIPRIGRFVDMEHAYRTMDKPFMESVWWVFKELYDKGLVYEDYRSMHICPRCETTLSQQEVSEGYKDVKDIAVTVKFKIKGVNNGYFLAWTTTPWTLPGNVALAVGKDITYVEAKVGDEILVLAKDRLSILTEPYDIVAEHKGSEMVGMEYEPPFDYYIKDKTLKNYENGWKVYAADFVTAESGTGIAHEAPAFGADDWELSKQVNLPFVQHVNMDGTMKPEATDFAGMEVKPKSDDDKVRLGTDIAVIRYLQEHGTFFSKENIVHSYPHCWRCDTPLLNYATSSWFVSVTKIKDDLLKTAKAINWSPEHIKEGRFGNWLEGARDWSISRQRFWASVIPIWTSENKKQYVIGGVEELKKYIQVNNNTFIFVRHGEAENNAQNIVNSDPKKVFHLTEKGKRDAQSAAEKIKTADVFYVSPYVRTKETAEIIAQHLKFDTNKIQEDARLSELDFGELSDGKFSDYLEYDEKNIVSYDTPLPKGESYNDAKKRFGQFLYDIDSQYSGKIIVVVTHGMGLEAAAAIMEGADLKRSKEIIDTLNPELGSILEFNFTPLPHNENYELDLHRPYIDEVVLVDEQGEKMTRVPDVLDTWFDSGSMPYGEWHYPFEHKDQFEAAFPAGFIAEGIDQTRAWFYYLHVLAGAIFKKNAFQNVIVNGIVLAEDGKKMSKKLQNYPDPMDIVDMYGADALRLYMASSPIMQAENLRFSEKSVDEVYKKIILRLQNVVTFYKTYVENEKVENVLSKNILDQWIISRLNQVNESMTAALDAYQLDTAARSIPDFVDDLSTWYIRRSRDRFKSDDKIDRQAAIATTRFVLIQFSQMIAPLMPFIAEEMYRELHSDDTPESVHLTDWPKAGKVDTDVLADMQKVRDIVTGVLDARQAAGIKVRQPLKSVKLKNQNGTLAAELTDLIKDEVNVKEITYDDIAEDFVLDTTLTPELITEGMVRDMIRAIQDLRKENSLTPKDTATLVVVTDPEGQTFIESNSDALRKSTNISDITFEDTEGEEIQLGDLKFTIELRH